MKAILFILIAIIQTNSDKRVLNIYARSKSDKLYLEQIKILAADPKGLKVRDIKIIEQFGRETFKITLTGKDRLTKLNSKSVLTLKKLYDTIDAMPMRKAEMLRPPTDYE